VAIVGYTNAGKSSLLRRLTGADVLVEDKLFATLDTTTRKVALPNKQPLLLTDTVGFVRKLPHHLVEAFNATLEEAVLSDFLIHLLDASQPKVLDFYQTTLHVLRDLGADEKRTLIALNKIDQVQDPATLASLRRNFPEAEFISVHTGQGLDSLLQRMSEFVSGGSRICELRIPHSQAELTARLHRQAKILESEYLEDALRVVALLPPRLAQECTPFIQDSLPETAHPLP
jgi:GTP-binding protein HflX